MWVRCLTRPNACKCRPKENDRHRRPAHHQEVTNVPASGLDQTLGFIGSPSWLPTLRELTLCVVLNSPGCASPAALGFFFRMRTVP
jgi:hypothetical protein